MTYMHLSVCFIANIYIIVIIAQEFFSSKVISPRFPKVSLCLASFQVLVSTPPGTNLANQIGSLVRDFVAVAPCKTPGIEYGWDDLRFFFGAGLESLPSIQAMEEGTSKEDHPVVYNVKNCDEFRLVFCTGLSCRKVLGSVFVNEKVVLGVRFWPITRTRTTSPSSFTPFSRHV